MQKYVYMYEMIVRYCVSICQKKVGDDCFYRREKKYVLMFY